MKSKGDYYRYLIESTPLDNDLSKYLEEAKKSYGKAEEMCFDSDIPLICRIGLVINYTLFLRDICEDYDIALKKAKKYYEALKKTNCVEDNSVTSYFKILENNITKWERERLGIERERLYKSVAQISLNS